MKIVNLQAENIKRLKAVNITPEDSVVVLSGANAQGKSSVLDAIWLAVGGRAASSATDRPVRDGEDTAQVRLDLGDIVVTRKWKGDKTTLTVEGKDGAKYSSPQSILDGLVGKLAFDPLAFATWDAKKQREVLMGLVDLPFNPDTLDAERKALFDKRTDVNRQVKQHEGQLAGMVPAPAGTPDEEVSVSELLTQYHTARDEARLTVTLRQDVERNEQLVEQLKEKLAQAEQDLAGNRAALAARPPMPDLTAMQEQLEDVDNINANVRAKQEYMRTLEARDSLQESADWLTAEIEQLDTRKAKGLAEAAYPITGLGFDDDGVTYNGVPFKQASSAEQLRVSTAMGMALNPGLRVMHIRDGSLLDSRNLALIGAMADANDFQIWVERVDESGTVGIVIEDGEVKAA